MWSPVRPTFALRSYLPKDHPLKALEIGSEPTPGAFIETMVAVFREVRRCLHPSGLLFLNLGDSYGTTGGTGRNRFWDGREDEFGPGNRPENDPRNKLRLDGQLLNIPHRVAEALRADGWHWRQTIVWAKRCLSGGTWLYARTAKGDSPAMLKDLVRLDPKTVQLWDGQKWTQVLGWTRTPTARGSRRRGEQSGYLEIVLRSGERIGCTAEHRWPTDRGVVFASDLRIGDVLQTCRLPEPENVQPLCLPDKDFGWLLGFYLAEGCQTDKGISFSIHADETEAFEKVRRLAELVGGTASYQKRKGKAASVVVYSKTLGAFIGEYITGQTCHNKRLGRKAWMRGNEFLAALLDGYLEGDGHADARGFWVVGFTNNDGLATDLRCLCARLGKVCVLRRTNYKCNGKSFPGWRGRIREPSGHWNAEPRGKVVAIENSRARKFWDITVADEPNLFALASGVLSHNSPMPESVKGWRWERHRVKVKSQKNPQEAGLYAAGAGNRLARPGSGGVTGKMPEEYTTKWSPCPGCPKCIPHGGYVLRKGKGRCTTAHEFIFVMSKSPVYFWDSAAFVEEALKGAAGSRFDLGKTAERDGGARTQQGYRDSFGRNPRSVWHISIPEGCEEFFEPVDCDAPSSVFVISAEPTSVAHFAVYPSELVRRCLQAGTSDGGCCPKCGMPWAPVVESDRQPTRPGVQSKVYLEPPVSPGSPVRTHAGDVCGNRDPKRHCTTTKVVDYWPTCDCGAKSVPCRVLDPFAGICTTLRTALRMNRHATGIELNPEYVEVAKRLMDTPPPWWRKQHGTEPVKDTLGQLKLF